MSDDTPPVGARYEHGHDEPPRVVSANDIAIIRASLDARRYVDWYDIECLMLSLAKSRRDALEEAIEIVVAVHTKWEGTRGYDSSPAPGVLREVRVQLRALLDAKPGKDGEG